MNTLSYKTQSANKGTVEKKWFVIDGEGEVVGRLATKVATYLRGKHKPSFTPHVDCGDNVIVINAEKVRFTGNKMKQKEYKWYSGYPGGLKDRTAEEMLAKKPRTIVESAVRGMLPKNKLGNEIFRNLFVYEGAEHPHTAQKPEELKVS